MINVALPPRGFLARRFVELAVMFLRGVEISGDMLVLNNCMDFHQSLLKIINELKRTDVFLTANDKRSMVSKVSKHLGLDPSSRITAIDLLKGLADVIDETKEECISKNLIENITTINILKANFYEYGRTYLSKPSDKYITIDKLPMIIQLLGMLGILIADVGYVIEKKGTIHHYYVLPSDGIVRKILVSREEDILKYFNLIKEVLRRYYDAPRALLTLRVATELVKAGCKEDMALSELVNMQEKKGGRATLLSTELITTEGLINLFVSMGVDRAERIATKLGIISDIAVESEDKTHDVVVRIATYLLIYARTGSLDALYQAVALVSRLSRHVREGTKEFKDLVGGLEKTGVKKPAEWLIELCNLMVGLMNSE